MASFPVPIALQLAQIGALSAQHWATRLEGLGLTPSEVVVLRVIAQLPDGSQRQVADAIGIVPSRVVALVDALEDKGLIVRQRSVSDRRRHCLTLTERGQAALGRLGAVGREHGDDIVGPLTERERRQLTATLDKLISAHGLRPGIHPGLAGS